MREAFLCKKGYKGKTFKLYFGHGVKAHVPNSVQQDCPMNIHMHRRLKCMVMQFDYFSIGVGPHYSKEQKLLPRVNWSNPTRH